MLSSVPVNTAILVLYRTYNVSSTRTRRPSTSAEPATRKSCSRNWISCLFGVQAASHSKCFWVHPTFSSKPGVWDKNLSEYFFSKQRAGGRYKHNWRLGSLDTFRNWRVIFFYVPRNFCNRRKWNLRSSICMTEQPAEGKVCVDHAPTKQTRVPLCCPILAIFQRTPNPVSQMDEFRPYFALAAQESVQTILGRQETDWVQFHQRVPFRLHQEPLKRDINRKLRKRNWWTHVNTHTAHWNAPNTLDMLLMIRLSHSFWPSSFSVSVSEVALFFGSAQCSLRVLSFQDVPLSSLRM